MWELVGELNCDAIGRVVALQQEGPSGDCMFSLGTLASFDSPKSSLFD